MRFSWMILLGLSAGGLVVPGAAHAVPTPVDMATISMTGAGLPRTVTDTICATDGNDLVCDRGVYITSSSRVGIGTAAPSSTLHVSGTGQVDGTLTTTSMFIVSRTQAGHWAEIDLLSGRTTNNERNWNITNNASSGNLYFRSLDDARNTQSIPATFLRDGRVGISNTDPAVTLHIGGSVRLGVETSATMNTCDANRTGAVRFTGGDFSFCRNGSSWESLTSLGGGGVASPTNVPAFRVTKSVDQSVATNTATLLTWNIENLDTYNNFSGNRFTPTVSGVYLIDLSVTCKQVSSGGNACVAYIFKNGSLISSGVTRSPLYNYTSRASTIVSLNGTTDYVEGYVLDENNPAAVAGGDGTYLQGSLLASGNGLISGSTALGDRITSGTASGVVAMAGGTISFTTGGTSGTAYLDTLGRFVGAGVSTTGAVSAASVYAGASLQLASPTAVTACTSSSAGTIRYNSPTTTLELCTGSGWQPMGVGIPAGTISAFASTTCPTGWSEYTAARGRFLRGIDNGAGNDPSGTRAPGTTQADLLASHQHGIDDYDGGGSLSGSRPIRGNGPTTSIHYTQLVGGAETRPKNVAVTFCQFNGTSNGWNNPLSGGSTSAAGSTGQLQYNTGNSFDASANLTWTNASSLLIVAGTISTTSITVGGKTIQQLIASASTGQGDRITSGTSAVVVNGSTNTISFTVAGTTTGYMDGLGRLVVPGISATTNASSFTTGYFSGDVGVGTSTANSPGYGRFQVWKPATAASYTALSAFVADYGSGNHSRLLVGQVVSNSMFLEAADQSNTKGTLGLQPYGGIVSVGSGSVSSMLVANGTNGYDWTLWARPSFSVSSGVILGTQGGVGAINGITGNGLAFAHLTLQSMGYNVGIGTTNPQYTLDVSGTLRSSAAIYAGLLMRNTSSSRVYSIYSHGNGSLVLGDETAAAGRLLIDSWGNVNVPSGSVAVAYGSGLGSAALQPGTAGNAGYTLYSTSSTQLGYVGWGETTNGINMTTYGNWPLNFYTNNAFRMRITGSGNIGIGTLNPQHALDVYATSGHAIRAITSANAHGIWAQSQNAGFGGVIGVAANGTTYGVLGHANAYSLYGNGRIYTADNTAGEAIYGSNSNNGVGVRGYSSGSYGLMGESASTYGIYGRSNNAGLGGVLGYTQNSSYYGILGYGNQYSFYGSGELYNNGNVRLNIPSANAYYYACFDGSLYMYYGATGCGSSDRRLKENIATLENSLEKIVQLRGASYTWKDPKRGEGPQVGLIAQEVEQVYPQLVSTDSRGIKSVDYAHLGAEQDLLEIVR